MELVPSPWTDADVIEKTKKLMTEIGQSPIVVKKEVNGFVLNRLQYALLMEAWRLVEVFQFFTFSFLIQSSFNMFSSQFMTYAILIVVIFV